MNETGTCTDNWCLGIYCKEIDSTGFGHTSPKETRRTLSNRNHIGLKSPAHRRSCVFHPTSGTDSGWRSWAAGGPVRRPVCHPTDRTRCCAFRPRRRTFASIRICCVFGHWKCWTRSIVDRRSVPDCPGWWRSSWDRPTGASDSWKRPWHSCCTLSWTGIFEAIGHRRLHRHFGHVLGYCGSRCYLKKQITFRSLKSILFRTTYFYLLN